MRTRSWAGAATTVLAVTLLTANPALAHDDRRSGEDGRTFHVTTRSDTVDVHPGDGECADEEGRCSLRAAVQEANASGGGRIELEERRYTLDRAGRGEDDAAKGDLDVRGRITIKGDGATLDAAGIDRVLDVMAGASLTLRHLTVTGGAATGDPMASGGGVQNAGVLEVDRSTITRNSANRAGGGIEAVAGSTTTLSRATLSENSTGATPGNGGGLHLTGAGTVHVDRTRVTGNTAALEGGGLWNSAAGTMTVDRSTIDHNTASGTAEASNGGGGLFNDGGTLTVTRSEVAHNVADGATLGSGGGILNNAGALVVERTTIVGNSAVRAGGGIEANAGTTRLERTHLTRNETGANPGNGGGLHLTGKGEVRIDRGSVTRNSAAAEGGGLWNSEPGTMTVTRTEIRGNRAPLGPDVFQDGNGTGFTVDGRVVPANGS